MTLLRDPGLQLGNHCIRGFAAFLCLYKKNERKFNIFGFWTGGHGQNRLFEDISLDSMIVLNN